MAERLTFLATCFVVFGNHAYTVPGLYRSGSQLLDDWNIFPREPGCAPLDMRFGARCAEFSANTTRSSGGVGFNFLHHLDQREAGQQLATFDRLLERGCSRDLQFLLCSYHFPICSENQGDPITPCRSLCQRVKSDCSPVLRANGLQWPSTLNCSDLLVASVLPRFVNAEEKMHICVDKTSQLERATQTTPPQTRAPELPPKPVVASCPPCNSSKVKKKILKKAKYNWLFSGVINSKAIVKGKRICYKANITNVFYSHCNNTQEPEVGTSVNVCVLRDAPTCTPCPAVDSRDFAIRKEVIFGGKLIRSARYIIDLKDFPMFFPHKTALAKKIPPWIRKFYQKRCPS